MVELVRKVAEKVFIPFTVGGGIRSIEDISQILNAGADKVSINSSALKDSKIIQDASDTFGSQCIVLAIDVKREKNTWIVYSHGGTRSTDKEAISWAKEKAGILTFIPALEVTAKGAHILALDPIELIKPYLSIAETVDLIHDQGALAILAHPFGLPKSWVRFNQVKKAAFDAIEVANSAQFPYEYICSLNQLLADSLNLPVTGGSDSHIPETIGRSYTIVDSESNDPDDVLKAIRLGNTTTGGSYTRIIEWFSKNLRKKKRLTG